jgi:hypothetical protein
MTPDNMERRKNEQARWDKIYAFMSRIDERNFQKDLSYAVQGDVITKHEERITSLETTRTQLKTVGVVASSSFGIWLMNKLGIHF